MGIRPAILVPLAGLLLWAPAAAGAPFGADDTFFSGDGWVELGPGAGASAPDVGDIAAAADGSPWVAGTVVQSGVRRIALWKLTSGGDTDPGFAGGGPITIGSGMGDAVGRAVAPLASGALVGGVGGAVGTPQMASAKVLASGGLDGSFGTAGVALVSSGSGGSPASCAGVMCQDDDGAAGDGATVTQLVALANGKFVAVGYAGAVISGGPEVRPDRVIIALLKSDGTLEASFGTSGRAQFYLGAAARARPLAVTVVGTKLRIATAFTDTSGVGNYSEIQLDAATGALDTAFDSDGYAEIAAPGGTHPSGAVFGAGGTSVFTGISGTSPATLSLARMDASGALDPSFGTGGYASTAEPGGLSPAHTDPVALGGGDIVTTALGSGTPRPLTLRATNASGGVSDFGSAGTLATLRSCGSFDAVAVALDGSGRLLAAGAGTEPTAGAAIAVARYVSGAPSASMDCSPASPLPDEPPVIPPVVPPASQPGFGADTAVSLSLAAKRTKPRKPVTVVVTNANAFALAGSLSGEAGKSKPVPLTSTPFVVDADAQATVPMRLPAKLRKAFKRKHKLAIRFVADVSDPEGASRTVNETLKPKLKR